MSKELTSMQSFQERLQNKVRDDIAAMLPDEVIAEMVKKATHQLFFERTTETISEGYGRSRVVEKPSMFEQLVRDAAEPIIQAAAGRVINGWIAAGNEGVVEKIIRERVDAGLVNLVVQSFDQTLQSALYSGESPIMNAIAMALKNRGF